MKSFHNSKHTEDGLATLVFITLLAIMMLIVIANSAALIHLHREVRLLEQQQVKRLNGSQTNSAPVALNVIPQNHHE